MDYKSICYHVRLLDGTKICAGSFGGQIDMETVNRLVKAHFDVKVTNSGRVVFADRKTGREIIVSLSIDASKTDKGIEALKSYRAEQARLQDIEDAQEEARTVEIEHLLDGLSHAEIVRRLSSNT